MPGFARSARQLLTMKPPLRFVFLHFTFPIWLFAFVHGQAQPNSYPYKVAQDRMLWHDKVDKEQQKLFAATDVIKQLAET